MEKPIKSINIIHFNLRLKNIANYNKKHLSTDFQKTVSLKIYYQNMKSNKPSCKIEKG